MENREHGCPPSDISGQSGGELELINISSDSEGGFTVQQPDVFEIEERLRIGQRRKEHMTALFDAKVALLLSHEVFNVPDEPSSNDLAGTDIERKMTAMMEKFGDSLNLSMSSFVDTNPNFRQDSEYQVIAINGAGLRSH